MKKAKKTLTQALAIVCAGAMLIGVVNVDYGNMGSAKVASASEKTITSVDSGLIDTHTEDYFDPAKVYQLTDTVTADTEISVILSLDADTVLEKYNNSDSNLSFTDYNATPEAQKARTAVIRDESKLVKKLNRSGIDYSIGETYDTLVNGFEVTIKAGDYSALAEAVPEATLIVGEEYEECETEVVTNDVDVYDTGIFNSSESKYQGDGVVVAVLDTGLDYTHSAFAVENFSHDESIPLAYTKDDVETKVSGLHAATTTADLTSSDVYISEKIPYQYDYADKDTDVFPINSDHGTHVSGIITSGDNGVIKGVAPAAQLMMMKVFSDTSSGAKTSWILAALEDCVKLGVDVINMSLGSSCGFSREVDNESVNEIYDEIEASGISMVCAGSNDYNATYGSEKNGSLGLTSNPDSGTVGSPSTYDATMSVASVSGVASNYMLFGDEVIYFNDATDSTATTRTFFDDLMRRYEEQYGVTTSEEEVYEIPYEVISGLGRNSDYYKDDYSGEIVLVKRGTTTFEEKIRIAMNHNALGIIIYNNVSGDISMSIGSNDGAAACSISQDDGEMLVAAGGGTLKISKSQAAGPFMSDFSSWGPTSDLKIKPEITAHGGEIYSCIPGENYDRLSGTSMAAPNTTGVTALVRQYVKENEDKFGIVEGSDTYNTDVTSIVNKLEMSTADIIYNKNGLPYSVRKQGAGLINLSDAQRSDAYISTLNSEGKETDKAKLELGDDKGRSGVYTMSFIIKNISSSSIKYKIDGIVQTEGVSTTYTSHGDTTVSQDGKTLEGAETLVKEVAGGSREGNTVEVAPGGSATVTVQITLSEDDKNYIEDSFENGMYVEGFITLEQLEGSDSEKIDLNVPYLAFYGDWTEAPIFDEEYYDTNADEINSGLDESDKLMADAYATRVVGGLYDDYIAYMGTYYFTQDPAAIQVAASKDHIAMSNQSSTSYYNINNLYYVYAGLLRNVKEIDVSITEDLTGKTIYTDTVYNQRKSYGTSSIYTSAIDMKKFSAYENNLKNNTQYTVTLEAYIDYGEKEEQNNKRNTFSFPLFIDYEAPVLTGVEFRQEYDSVTKKTSLYADLSIYDNHYAMAAQVGNVTNYTGTGNYLFSLDTFGNYFTPISSSFNSTTLVSIDMTDYVNDLKDSAGYTIKDDGTYVLADHTNSFIVVIYDYAMNSSIFEVRLPDEIITMYFDGDQVETMQNGDVTEAHVTLALNETLDLTTILNVYPSTSWLQTFDYVSSAPAKVSVVNQTALALDYTGSNPVKITVSANTESGGKFYAYLYVTVEGDKGYTLPVINSFSLKSYYVNKAFYSMSSDDREIGYTGGTYGFDDNASLSMYPSEQVTVTCDLQTYFPNDTYIEFTVANSSVAEVYTKTDGTGVITAKNEGTTSVTATVYYNDPSRDYAVSQRSLRISITVKDPFTVSSIYLISYKGGGDENGVVEIPDDRGITTIYEFAFSNYEYIEKDLDAGDVIDDEDPYNTKPWYIGDDTITKVIIPEGVKEIQGYAFAGLTALEEVVFPSTLTRIGYGAFYKCTALTTITFSGENNVQFINDEAFYGCESLETYNFTSVVAIGKYAFYGCDFNYVNLARSCQSLGEGAFMNNRSLLRVYIAASSIKIDSWVFAGCVSLEDMTINAAVIPSYAFCGCKNLETVTFGVDVSVINAYAFYGTNVSNFTVNGANTHLQSDGNLVYSDNYTVLQTVAPTASGSVVLNSNTTTISNGAFAGTSVTAVTGDSVKYIKDYAFAGCENLTTLSLGNLIEIGAYAFYEASITTLPTLASSATIGAWAFAKTSIEGELEISKGINVDEYAFSGCDVESVRIGDGCEVGAYAFYGCEKLKSVGIGKSCVIGDFAFAADMFPDAYTWAEKYYAATGDENLYEYYKTYGKAYVNYEYTITNPENGDDVRNAGDYIYTNNYIAKYFYMDLAEATDSNLETVTMGSATTLGTGAFENCSKMISLAMGTEEQKKADIVVGDYAFYNCVSLGSITYSKNIVEIGAYAFSVTPETIDLMYPAKDAYEYPSDVILAYAVEFVEGEVAMMGYKYTQHYTSLSGEIDLSGVTKLGEGAFAYNKGITGIVLGDIEGDGEDLTKIPAYAFYMCMDLEKICRASDDVTGCESNLSDFESVGDFAFAYTKISGVVLQDQIILGDGVFYMCEELVTAENLENVRSFGAFALAYTAIGTSTKTLTLSGAEYIGDYAFAYVSTGDDGPILIDFLGEKGKGEGSLIEIGENPFLGTNVSFTITEPEMFNGAELGDVETETYEINETAFVSGGVLYSRFEAAEKDGNVLVSYPMGKTETAYTVETGTVRISAHAFDGNTSLEIVTLSSELESIGDKAFYGCESLSIVIFTSYYAPALEEEYDEDYWALVANYPAAHYMSGYYTSTQSGNWYQGLGIVEYEMWSVGPNNYFYGANFVDYIGKIENKLIMVAPVNGKNYDSFTLAQYFDTVIYGAAAATEDTLYVIALIDTLPSTITLDWADTIYEALDAYNMLSLEQQALVTNYSKLTSSLGQLEFLQSLQGGDDGGAEGPATEKSTSSSFLSDNMWGLIIALVILLAFVALLVYTLLMRKKKGSLEDASGSGDTEISGEAPVEDALMEDTSLETDGKKGDE